MIDILIDIYVDFYRQVVYNIKHKRSYSIDIANQYLGGSIMATLSVTDNPSLQGLCNGTEVSFDMRKRQLEEEAKKEEEAKERAKKSIYKDFAQVNRKEMIHMRALIKSDPNAALVLMFIMEKMDKMNALVCSYKVFEEQLGLCRATLSKAVKTLKDKGFLYVYKSGTSNVYVMNNQLAWTNHGDKAEYCLFPANVVLSAAEQDMRKQDKTIKPIYTKSLDQLQDPEQEATT